MISEMGYRDDSPYRGRKQITINTPTGLIDMSQTGIPLMANGRYLPPYSGMHQFNTNKVVEKRMQEGGMTREDMYNYLFDEQQQEPQLPGESDLDNEVIKDKIQESILENERYQLSMTIANQPFFRGNQSSDYMGRINSPSLKLGVNPNVTKVGDELKNNFGVYSKGIWGDRAHQQRKSDHNTGDAEDFGFKDPSQADAAIKNLQDKDNVKYIIYKGKIWNPSVSKEWRPYNGPNPHNEHFHVSYNK